MNADKDFSQYVVAVSEGGWWCEGISLVRGFIHGSK